MLRGPDAADVGLVDVRVDLHLRQIRGDDEQRRRLHAGRDRLADIHVALRDDAVDWRRDHGVIDVHLILIHGRLRLADRRARLRDGRLLRRERGLRHIDRDLRRIEIALREQAPGRELLRARVLLLRVLQLYFALLQIALRLGQIRLCLRQIGAGLLQLRLEERRIEPRDHLSFAHDRIEVGAEPGDVARHLASHLHGRHRLERAGRADRIDDVTAADRRGLHLDVGCAAPDVVRPGACADGRDDDEDRDRSLHDYRLVVITGRRSCAPPYRRRRPRSVP